MFKKFSAALVAAFFVLSATITQAQTPNITGNEFQTQTPGKAVPGMVPMCFNVSNQAVPCGTSGTGTPSNIIGSIGFGPVAPGAATATSSSLMGCRYNSTANDTVANDQGAVSCNQLGQIVADGLNVTPPSLTSTGNLFIIPDTSGYGGISITVSSAGTGVTITPEVSDNGSAWNGVQGYKADYSYNSPLSATTTTGTFIFPTYSKQFRYRISSYVSGTVTVSYTLRKDPPPRQSMSVAINNAIGNNNVGGYDQSLTACNSGCSTNTLVVANSSHNAGTAIGPFSTLAYFRTAGGTGILNNVHWIWRTATNLTSVTVYLFTANPSASTCTDAVALSIGAADVPKLVVGSPFVLNPAAAIGATFSIGAQQLPMSTKNSESTTSLYACVVANTTVTPAANDGVLGVSGIQD
jgi:hypothetical protein